MVKFEKNKLIINGVVIKEFNYQIRTIVEVEDTIIVLLEIPFDNTIEKNNIVPHTELEIFFSPTL